MRRRLARFVTLVAILGGVACTKKERLGDAALRAAAGRGNLEATRALLAAGADPDHASTAKRGIKPLLLASYGGHTSVVQELLAQRAPVDSENTDRETALMVCGGCELAAVAEAGVDLAKGPPRTAPPLILAAAVGNLELVRRHLDHGARLEQTNPQGGTALRAAADVGWSTSCASSSRRAQTPAPPRPVRQAADRLRARQGARRGGGPARQGSLIGGGSPEACSMPRSAPSTTRGPR